MNSPCISAGMACGSRSSARPRAAFWFRVKSCSSAEVVRIFISVGTARLSPIFTRLALLARDLIGSGFSAAAISGGTASVAFISPSTPAAMVARSKSSSEYSSASTNICLVRSSLYRASASRCSERWVSLYSSIKAGTAGRAFSTSMLARWSSASFCMRRSLSCLAQVMGSPGSP